MKTPKVTLASGIQQIKKHIFHSTVKKSENNKNTQDICLSGCQGQLHIIVREAMINENIFQVRFSACLRSSTDSDVKRLLPVIFSFFIFVVDKNDFPLVYL